MVITTTISRLSPAPFESCWSSPKCIPPRTPLLLLCAYTGATSSVTYSAADLGRALLNLLASLPLDDSTHVVAQALTISLTSCLTWSQEHRTSAEALLKEFLEWVDMSTALIPPNPLKYKLTKVFSAERVDFFAELLLRLPHDLRLSILTMELGHILDSMEIHPCPAAATIFAHLVPRVRATYRVLQRVNPTPYSPPTGLVFGPLTLADSPPPAIITPTPPALSLEAAPAPLISVASLPPPSLPPCTPRAQPCRSVSGQRRRRQSSTWTSPRYKPPRSTFLLHRCLWNHAPWLDPVLSPAGPGSRASQAFVWLSPPRPRKPP